MAPENTQPFEQRGRLFAHNGVVEDLPRLERKLGDDLELVHGHTDSERLFALITRETARHGGDPGAGIVAAARWVAAELPIFAINVILAGPEDLRALRHPDVHELWVLEHGTAGPSEIALDSAPAKQLTLADLQPRAAAAQAAPPGAARP